MAEMDRMLKVFRDDAPPSAFGPKGEVTTETPEEEAARRAANRAQVMQGSFGGAAAQVPALRPELPPAEGVPPALAAQEAPLAMPAPAPQPVAAPQAEPMPAQPMATPVQAPAGGVKPAAGGLSPLLKERDDIYNKKLELVDTQLNIEREKNDQIALANEDSRFQLQKKREQDAAEAQQIAADSKKAADASDSAVREFNMARNKDPHADVSVGQSILAAIAQGLGAFGAAMTGGQNTAAAIVSKAADMRVRKWERDLDEAKEGVRLKDNRVAHFRQLGMDKAAASRSAMASLLDQSAEAVDRIKSQYTNNEVLQRADGIKLGLTEERNKLRIAEEQAAMAARTKAMLAAQPKPMSIGDQVKMRGLEVDVPQGDGSKVKFFARSEPEAAKIRDAQKVAAGVRSDLNVLRGLIKGSPTLNPQTRQQVEILNNSIRKKYIKLDELGVPTGKDLELSSVIGDPRSWTQTTGQTLELMGRVEADMADRLNNAYQVQGFEGAQ